MAIRFRTSPAVAHRFAPAAPGEEVVYGACAPMWHTDADQQQALSDWLSFVRGRGIERVCSLVPGDDAAGPLDGLRRTLGNDAVRHVPLADSRLAAVEPLRDRLLPFLDDAAATDERVVVYGLAGLGRTGQALAAWLVHGRGHDPRSAVATVSRMGRTPLEPVEAGNATERDLYELLATFQ